MEDMNYITTMADYQQFDDFFDYGSSVEQSPASATSSQPSIHSAADYLSSFTVPATYSVPSSSPSSKRRSSRPSVHFASSPGDDSSRVHPSQSPTDSSVRSDNLHLAESFRRKSSTTSQSNWFSTPPARSYLPPPSLGSMSGPSEAEIDQHIKTLQSHRVNTVVELRRIEKSLVSASANARVDVSQPMTAAWSHYVNSHALLTELRAITRNYPFSAECLEEAKRRVYQDPESNRSWNLCWLVLNKVQTDNLVPYYAYAQASLPAMWGGQTPTPEGIQQLSTAFTAEWNWALSQMLRHWSQAPRR